MKMSEKRRQKTEERWRLTLLDSNKDTQTGEGDEGKR